MKRQFLFIISVFVCISLGVSKEYSNNPVTLISENENEIIVKFVLPSFSFRSVSVDGKYYHSISADGASYHDKKGLPALPFYSQSIVIPVNTTIKTDIVHIETEIEKNRKILPSKGPISRNVNPLTIPYTFGTVYNKNLDYPRKIVSTGKPYFIRNIHGVVVHFHPFQYNPEKNLIKIAQTIIVKLTKVQSKSSSGLINNKIPFLSPAFDRMYKEHFVNYGYGRSEKSSLRAVSEGDKMVIITTSEYLDVLAELVEWKNRKGIITELYEYPYETGGEGADNIQIFLEQKYINDDITYILLVGDIDDIPSHYSTDLWDGQSGYTDPQYSLLNGDDFYPDAFVGRLSVENTDEAQVMVSKILKYEREPDINGEWYHKAIGIAGTEGSPPDSTWMNYFRDSLLAYTYTKVDQFYGYTTSSFDVTDAVNEGRSWITYMGHGYVSAWSTTGFNNSNIFTLENEEKLPVIISVACLNGKFESDCFAEVWTRYQYGGAIAFLGSSINQAWTPPQYGAENIISNLKQEKYISLGGVIYNGEIDMLERTTSTNSKNAINATFLTWTLFGDPSLMVNTNTPTQLSVTHPSEIPMGFQTISISSENNTRICLYSKSQDIQITGIVSSRKKLELTIDPTDIDTIYVTGTKRNRVPYMGAIIPNASYSNYLRNEKMPGSGKFYLRKHNKSVYIKTLQPGKYAVTLCDSKGRTLASRNISKSGQWVPLNSPVSTGLYYLVFTSNNKSFIHKYFFIH